MITMNPVPYADGVILGVRMMCGVELSRLQRLRLRRWTEQAMSQTQRKNHAAMFRLARSYGRCPGGYADTVFSNAMKESINPCV